MMSKMSKREYLRELKKKYCRSSKKHKTQLLDNFCEFAGYHRKAALRLVNNPLPRKKTRPIPRKKKYDLETVEALKKLWFASGEICAERFHPFIRSLLKCLIDQNQIEVTDETKKQLHKISLGKTKAIISKTKRRSFIKIGALTKPGSILKNQIALRFGPWEQKEPGFFEADTVAHCGGDISGEFVYSLDIIDIASGWSEQAAIWGKGEAATRAELDKIRKRLPFEMKGLDPDNGGEFINYQMHRYCKKHGISLTRAREYHPNDQAHIEQKNYTAIRRLIGYGRLDKKTQQKLLNDLYDNEWRLFLNFFQPTMKLKKKIKNLETGKSKKTYYKAKTPYQRLMRSKHISIEQKLMLRSTYQTLNPIKLKREIDKKVELIRKTLK